MYKATRKYDAKQFAVKVLFDIFENYGDKEKQDIKNEIKLMKELNHPFIVNIIDDFINSTCNLCIMQELYLNGDFSNYLKQRQGNLFSQN